MERVPLHPPPSLRTRTYLRHPIHLAWRRREDDAQREREGRLPRWRKAELGVMAAAAGGVGWLLMPLTLWSPTPLWPLGAMWGAICFCTAIWCAKTLTDEQFAAIDKAANDWNQDTGNDGRPPFQ